MPDERKAFGKKGNGAPETRSGAEVAGESDVSQHGAERGRRERGGRGDHEIGDRESRGAGRREREFEEIMVSVYRCSATVKGGRRLSFAALVVVGDGRGRAGLGYGKAKEVPGAYQKAVKSGRKNMAAYPVVGDGTIPHAVTGRYGAATIRLIPARPGTGLIAGTAVKALLEVCGYKNILTKSFGSNNAKNLLKATLNALGQLRSKEQIEALRGVKLDGDGR